MNFEETAFEDLSDEQLTYVFGTANLDPETRAAYAGATFAYRGRVGWIGGALSTLTETPANFSQRYPAHLSLTGGGYEIVPNSSTAHVTASMPESHGELSKWTVTARKEPSTQEVQIRAFAVGYRINREHE